MAAFDGGLKYHGLSLEGEYFLRWLDHFQGPGTAVLAPIFSHGYQLQASAMVLPKTLQAYLGGSTISGKYGNPWDFRAELICYPFQQSRAVEQRILPVQISGKLQLPFPSRSEEPDLSLRRLSS